MAPQESAARAVGPVEAGGCLRIGLAMAGQGAAGAGAGHGHVSSQGREPVLEHGVGPSSGPKGRTDTALSRRLLPGHNLERPWPQVPTSSGRCVVATIRLEPPPTKLGRRCGRSSTSSWHKRGSRVAPMELMLEKRFSASRREIHCWRESCTGAGPTTAPATSSAMGCGTTN